MPATVRRSLAAEENPWPWAEHARIRVARTCRFDFRFQTPDTGQATKPVRSDRSGTTFFNAPKKILQKRRASGGVSSNRSSPTHRVFTTGTPAADADLRAVFAQVPVYRTKPFLFPGTPPSGHHSAVPVVRPFVVFPGHSGPCTVPSPFRDGHSGAVRPAAACFIALSFDCRRCRLFHRSTHSLVTKRFNCFFLI